MTAKKKLKNYRVKLRYTIVETFDVEAKSEMDIHELAADEISIPATGELVDWETVSVTEVIE